MSNPKQKDQQEKTSGPQDDPSRAPESGDPKEAGRQQGHVIDEYGTPGDANPDDKGGDTDFESGRHGTK